jgi:UDP-GlcNAc:undecaprenyl-phosphate GlcNAc-1-phosphate transferase
MWLNFLLLASVMSCALCASSRLIAQTAGLMDRPDGVRKLHDRATPLVGGLAVLVPVLLLTPAFGALTGQLPPYLIAALGAGAVAMLVGAADDRLGVGALLRLGTLAGVVLIAAMAQPNFIIDNLRVDPVKLVVPLGLLAVPLTLLVVVGFVNACNMADGVNGQFLGSTVVWSLLLAYYAPTSMQIAVLGLACCAAVALAFNLRGFLFSGSAGTYGVPMFLGLNALALYKMSNGHFQEITPVLWFWLPVADCLRLFAWRMIKGRSPFSPDRLHIHHTLERSVGRAGVLPVYLILLAAPGVVGVTSVGAGLATLVLCIAVYAAILGVDFSLRHAEPRTPEAMVPAAALVAAVVSERRRPYLATSPRRPLGENQAARPVLKPQRSQLSGGVGARINADAAVVGVRLHPRRMSVHDHLLETPLIVQEGRADP